MEQIFGYDEKSGPAPLYSNGDEIIEHFKSLTSIPRGRYYDKYIGINVDGNWQADNIRDAFGLGTTWRLLQRTSAPLWSTEMIKKLRAYFVLSSMDHIH